MKSRMIFFLAALALVSCTKKAENSSEDFTPVQEKSFKVSGVSIGYDQFTPYLCFQLVGGLFAVKNQYYEQRLSQVKTETDKQRVAALKDRTQKARVLMESKSKEISEMRKSQELSLEEKAKKSIQLIVEAYDTLKLFESDIMNYCHQEAQSVKDDCYKKKDQSFFDKCYDDMGKALNKKVLSYFNNQYAN